MMHHATPAFWRAHHALPKTVRDVADKNFALLKKYPRHPSLHFKAVGSLWSVRAGIGYRALAIELEGEGVVLDWIARRLRQVDPLIRISAFLRWTCAAAQLPRARQSISG